MSHIPKKPEEVLPPIPKPAPRPAPRSLIEAVSDAIAREEHARMIARTSPAVWRS